MSVIISPLAKKMAKMFLSDLYDGMKFSMGLLAPPLAIVVTIYTCKVTYTVLGSPLFTETRANLRRTISEKVSEYLDATNKAPDLTTQRDMRKALQDAPTIPATPPENNLHTHPRAAYARAAALKYASVGSKLIGREEYVVQQTFCDQRRLKDGEKVYRVAKDMVSGPMRRKLDPLRHSITMIDTDYKVDMHRLMTEGPTPAIIYTMQPEAAADDGADTDVAFCFNSDGTVRSLVSGGGDYDNDMLWDYHGDTISYVRIWMGFVTRLATYLVDRRKLTAHRYIITLIPLSYHVGIAANVAAATMEIPWATRLNPVKDGLVKILVNNESGLHYSLGQVGQFACANVSACNYSNICAAMQTVKNPTQGTVAGYLPPDTARMDAALVYLHAKVEDKKTTNRIVTVTPIIEYVYQENYRTASVDAPASMQAFMSPLIDPAFTPAKSYANDKTAVERRVLAFKGQPIYTNHMMDVALEFIDLLIPDNAVHSIVPTTSDDVYETLVNARQAALHNEAIGSGPNIIAKVRSFMKAEAADGPKDPRVISTLQPCDKLEWSSFMQPFAEYVKQYDWYAFGKTPVALARRVGQVLRACDSHVIETDYSRFDGHMTMVIKLLELCILLRAFPTIHHAQLRKQHAKQRHQNATTSEGFKYKTGTTRLSGSPETSILNTVVNAFLAYAGLRGTRVGRSTAYYSAAEAWAKLGIYAGDDGITPDVDLKVMTSTASNWGHAIEPVMRLRGEAGADGASVSFCSRFYSPTAWWDEQPSHMCDVKRQLAKLHLTANLPPDVTPTQKLVDKSRGLWYTDRYVPIIGPLVCRVEQFARLGGVRFGGRVGYSYTLTQFMTGDGQLTVDTDELCGSEGPEEWMQHVVHIQLPEFDYESFDHDINAAAGFPDLLRLGPYGPQVIRDLGASLVNGEVQGASIVIKKNDRKQVPNKTTGKSLKRTGAADPTTKGKKPATSDKIVSPDTKAKPERIVKSLQRDIALATPEGQVRKGNRPFLVKARSAKMK